MALPIPRVPRSELSMAAQLEYDELKPAWERGELRVAVEISAGKMTIRSYFRTHTVNVSRDIMR